MSIPIELLANRMAMIMDLAERDLTPVIMICVDPKTDFSADDFILRVTVATSENLDDKDVHRILWGVLSTRQKVETVKINL